MIDAEHLDGAFIVRQSIHNEFSHAVIERSQLRQSKLFRVRELRPPRDDIGLDCGSRVA